MSKSKKAFLLHGAIYLACYVVILIAMHQNTIESTAHWVLEYGFAVIHTVIGLPAFIHFMWFLPVVIQSLLINSPVRVVGLVTSAIFIPLTLWAAEHELSTPLGDSGGPGAFVLLLLWTSLTSAVMLGTGLLYLIWRQWNRRRE